MKPFQSKTEENLQKSEPKETTGANRNISSSKKIFPQGIRLCCRGRLLIPLRQQPEPTPSQGGRALSVRAPTQHGRDAAVQMFTEINKLSRHRTASKPPCPSLPRRSPVPPGWRAGSERAPGPSPQLHLRCRHAGQQGRSTYIGSRGFHFQSRALATSLVLHKQLKAL